MTADELRRMVHDVKTQLAIAHGHIGILRRETAKFSKDEAVERVTKRLDSAYLALDKINALLTEPFRAD